MLYNDEKTVEMVVIIFLDKFASYFLLRVISEGSHLTLVLVLQYLTLVLTGPRFQGSQGPRVPGSSFYCVPNFPPDVPKEQKPNIQRDSLFN